MHPLGSGIPFRSAGCRRPCFCSAAGGTRICAACWTSQNAPHAVGGQPALHIGPATHLQWWPQSSRLLLNFFQHHLQDHPSKDASDGVAMTGVHLWDQTKARWERTHTTNPAHQPIKESPGWSLSSTGLACLDPSEGSLIKDGSDGNGSDGSGSEGSGQVVIVHDPWRPVPAVGGHLSPTAGPVDRASVDQRSDVALFTGAPVTHRLQLSAGRCCSWSADQPGLICAWRSPLARWVEAVQQLSTGVAPSDENALSPGPWHSNCRPLHHLEPW